MTTEEIFTAAGFALTIGGILFHAGQTARENQKTRQDVNNIGRIVRTIKEEGMRDYLRLVANDAETTVPGADGERLGKLIRRDRVD